MQRIRTIISSIGSLGVFGLILLLITLVVMLTWLSTGAVRGPFDTSQRELVKLSVLEDKVSYWLLEMDINADYYDFSGGDEKYVQAYVQADTSLREALAEVEEKIVSLPATESEYLNGLLQAIDAHNQAFVALRAAVIAGDIPTIEAAQASLADHTAQAQKSLTDWTFMIKTNRAQAEIEQGSLVRAAISIGALGLVVLPLLAYWAFGMTGQITRPILDLTNAIISIQGGQLRPETLADVVERRDNLGQLARDIEAMSQELKSRREGLENELHELQQQIKEERRRRRI